MDEERRQTVLAQLHDFFAITQLDVEDELEILAEYTFIAISRMKYRDGMSDYYNLMQYVRDLIDEFDANDKAIKQISDYYDGV